MLCDGYHGCISWHRAIKSDKEVENKKAFFLRKSYQGWKSVVDGQTAIAIAVLVAVQVVAKAIL
jgi:hypothetical protein